MAVDPPGYGTAVDVTGASAYEAGAVVDIQATANPGNQFVIWSTTGGTLGDANAATTTLTMPAQNVTVTAHFVGPLDHFSGYYVTGDPPSLNKDVTLEDQFIAINTTVMWPEFFFNPVEKLHDDKLTVISNDNHHYTVYSLDIPEEEWGTWFVEVDNQFGTQNLTVVGPVGLAVPTQKLEPGGHDPPLGLDHYLLYEVDHNGEPPLMEESVNLLDQFVDDLPVPVLYPVLFANPVRKIHGTEVTEIRDPQDHVVFYFIGEGDFETQVQVNNQFGDQTFDVIGPDLLAVPSDKVNFAAQLDHFKGYGLGESAAINELVYLKDQFVDVLATVKWAKVFFNPVEKEIIEGPPPTPISHPDNHLTMYEIWPEAEPEVWFVVVENQFGIEELLVQGPFWLGVPTTKEGHGEPVGLNHFLIYDVISDPLYLEAPVTLHDQFGSEGATVWAPFLFANPVQKTHGATVVPIVDPWNHLLFYEISGTEIESGVQFDNQFGDAVTNHCYPADLLGVPSLKLFAEHD
jgi:hypothetical protein